jgi:hypothetical protein
LPGFNVAWTTMSFDEPAPSDSMRSLDVYDPSDPEGLKPIISLTLMILSFITIIPPILWLSKFAFRKPSSQKLR